MLIKTEANGLLTGEQEFTTLAAAIGLTPYELMLAFEFGIHRRSMFDLTCKECREQVGNPHRSVQGACSTDMCGDVIGQRMVRCPLDHGEPVTLRDMTDKAFAGRMVQMWKRFMTWRRRHYRAQADATNTLQNAWSYLYGQYFHTAANRDRGFITEPTQAALDILHHLAGQSLERQCEL